MNFFLHLAIKHSKFILNISTSELQESELKKLSLLVLRAENNALLTEQMHARKRTRNTLDISAVPILKKESHLPVQADVSHSTGCKDIVSPCAKAALAAGADGVSVEVHPDPSISLSDGQQQLNLKQFEQFYRELKESGAFK